MGHRQYTTQQMFEIDSDQGWNHAEQPYAPMASGVSESSSAIHHVANMPIQGGHFPSQWTPAPRPSGYSSPMINGELPLYQHMAPGPSHDPFLHQPSGSINMPQDNYSHHPSSSNIMGQTVSTVDAGFCDQTIVSGRGPYKRKSPGIPPLCDRGSTSRYHDAGSSSDIRLPIDPWQEKHVTDPYNTRWEYPPHYGVNNLSIGGEGSQRNVRSRATVDLETNLARTNLSNSSLHHSFPSRTSDQSNEMEFLWGHSSNAPSREWNRNLVPPASHGVTFSSDSSFLGHDHNAANTLNGHPNGSLEIRRYNNDVTSNRNPTPQYVNSHVNQSARGVRSAHGQRSAPSFRASSSNFHPGNVAVSDDGHHMVAESYPSRHSRLLSSLRSASIDRSGRNLVPSDRYRYPEGTSFRERLTPEGPMVVDHPAYYGSRALLDQHREMRLDVDNMSYEELLALGERIGTVNTGLSDDSIPKCLTESIYCSSDLLQDEGTCVICLEEYKNMDDVGTLKLCGHDFHVGCIRKWLSMKNLCPICKATAMDEKMEGK